MIAKLNAYGIDKKSLDFLHSYLSDRKQRCKVGSETSSWGNISTGVPQGSVLWPLVFNIFLNDFFFSVKKSSTTNFADDNTINAHGNTFYEIIYKLEHDIKI